MTTDTTTIEQLALLRRWQRGTRVLQVAHILAANHTHRLNRFVGIIVVILTTIVGTSIFASLQSQATIFAKIVVGLLSLAAAVLSSLQLFFRHDDVVQRHKHAFARYGELRREIEQHLACPPNTANDFCVIVERIRTSWDSADKETPPLPQKLHDRAIKQIDDHDRNHPQVAINAA
ncbi:MAG: SLATT domain-containing protein [Verrucomicrobiota bacterium]|jgi:hypothetical protein